MLAVISSHISKSLLQSILDSGNSSLPLTSQQEWAYLPDASSFLSKHLATSSWLLFNILGEMCWLPKCCFTRLSTPSRISNRLCKIEDAYSEDMGLNDSEHRVGRTRGKRSLESLEREL